ncbi:hypothetical protein pb186bvf_020657 [Paramecium bursaria]
MNILQIRKKTFTLNCQETKTHYSKSLMQYTQPQIKLIDLENQTLLIYSLVQTSCILLRVQIIIFYGFYHIIQQNANFILN